MAKTRRAFVVEETEKQSESPAQKKRREAKHKLQTLTKTSHPKDFEEYEDDERFERIRRLR